VKHRITLPYNEIGAFVAAPRGGGAAATLEFAILTAARTNEVIGARWSEIDLKTGIWTIPPARMKARVEYRVPSSDQVLKFCGKRRNERSMMLSFPVRRLATRRQTRHF
jgi:integrase